jgi:hypothetical protein
MMAWPTDIQPVMLDELKFGLIYKIMKRVLE